MFPDKSDHHSAVQHFSELHTTAFRHNILRPVGHPSNMLVYPPTPLPASHTEPLQCAQCAVLKSDSVKDAFTRVLTQFAVS